MGLGLKIPSLRRVTMLGGEDRGSLWEEGEEEVGWQVTGLRKAGLVRLVGGGLGGERSRPIRKERVGWGCVWIENRSTPSRGCKGQREVGWVRLGVRRSRPSGGQIWVGGRGVGCFE